MTLVADDPNKYQCLVEGFAYDPKTGDWTQRVTYEAQSRLEALRWMNMNRDWFKNLRIL